jgi:hypothetical protein
MPDWRRALASNGTEYDVFLSYARADNTGPGRAVERLVDQLASAYREVTGHELRVFFDQRAIATAQEWSREIRGALQRSALMIAVLSPAYFSSQWCAEEWDTFLRAGRERSITYGITPYLKILFPVALHAGIQTDHGHPETRRRIREAQHMQHKDFTGVAAGSEPFATLAAELARDLADALEMLGEVTQGSGAWLAAGLPAASAESPAITTRRAQDSQQFVRVLADAINVTIVGVTNENLASFLSQALELKRSRLGQDAFWESLRIVFLREDLLDLVNDELEAQRPRRQETFRERKQRAKSGKRAVVSFLVRQGRPANWWLYEYRYYLPFLGGLFGMADGTNLAQITIVRPRHSVGEALYFEFVDPADHYFANAFGDIVADSDEENEVVLVGTASDRQGFYVNGARFRRSALRAGENIHDWLPSVVIVTWTVRNGVAVPLLQQRTPANASHYIHHLSHVGGYVNESDLSSPGLARGRRGGTAVLLPREAAYSAAHRELAEQLDLYGAGDALELADSCHFRTHDRESLFFHIFTLEIPQNHQFPYGSDVQSWRIPTLTRLHLHQVLHKAARLVAADDLSREHRAATARILACQLTLHGQRELGERLVRGMRRPSARLAQQLGRLADEQAVRAPRAGGQAPLRGLAEFHYREFFSTLLPLYAQLGVPDAAAAVREVHGRDGAADAQAQLEESYADDDLMSSLPFEA